MITNFSSIGFMLFKWPGVIDETGRTHYYRMESTDVNGSNMMLNIQDGTYSLNKLSCVFQTAPNSTVRNGTNSLTVNASANNYAYLNTGTNLYSDSQTITFKFNIAPGTFNNTNNFIFVSSYNNNASSNGNLRTCVSGGVHILSYVFNNPSTTEVIIQNPFTTGTIHHIAIVKNGRNGISFIYNGLLVNTLDNSTIDYKLFNNSNDNQFFFGRNNIDALYFTGYIDDFRMYSRCLSQEEINVLRMSRLT